MEIVIEYVFIDNCIIDFFILLLTAKFLSLNYKKYRIILAVIFGSILALIFPLLNFGLLLQICFKLLSGIGIILIAFNASNFKSFLLNFLVFISVTCLFGGIFIMISILEFGALDSMTISLYNNNIPLGLITLFVALYVFLINGVINYIKKKIKLNKFIYKLTLKTKFKKIKINGYLDSAHNLSDPITKQSVLIINYITLNKLYKIPIEEIISHQIPNDLPNARYIKYQTIDKKDNQMLIFTIEELQIEQIKSEVSKKNQIVGLSLVDFKKNFNCDALISANLL